MFLHECAIFRMRTMLCFKGYRQVYKLSQNPGRLCKLNECMKPHNCHTAPVCTSYHKQRPKMGHKYSMEQQQSTNTILMGKTYPTP
jgi:hypothetical protein